MIISLTYEQIGSFAILSIGKLSQQQFLPEELRHRMSAQAVMMRQVPKAEIKEVSKDAGEAAHPKKERLESPPAFDHRAVNHFVQHGELPQASCGANSEG
jgi:hypothetical protein